MTSIDTIKTALTPIFEKYGVRKAILFGSFAKNTMTEKSDVDLLVDSGLKGLKFVGFTEDIQTPSPVPPTCLILRTSKRTPKSKKKSPNTERSSSTEPTTDPRPRPPLTADF